MWKKAEFDIFFWVLNNIAWQLIFLISIWMLHEWQNASVSSTKAEFFIQLCRLACMSYESHNCEAMSQEVVPVQVSLWYGDLSPNRVAGRARCWRVWLDVISCPEARGSSPDDRWCCSLSTLHLWRSGWKLKMVSRVVIIKQMNWENVTELHLTNILSIHDTHPAVFLLLGVAFYLVTL